VLVDEINRAMPKTQSALLESMAEHQVTVDGATRILPQPFLVMATENPIEYEGDVPAARGAARPLLPAHGARLPRPRTTSSRSSTSSATATRSRTCARLSPSRRSRSCGSPRRRCTWRPVIQRWIVDLVRATREVEDVSIGASVRGSLALERAGARVGALHGRSYVVPEDVERLFNSVLVHRVVFRPAFLAEARKTGWDAAIDAFRGRCLELAPRPQPEDVDLTVVPG
jgi:MoxR-like ATPase